MTAYFCPDCGSTQVPPPRRGKDGRCGPCRSQVGRRSQRGNTTWRDYDHDELLTRLDRAR